MSYLVCHMEKYKRQDVSPVEKENERDEKYDATNPQIDSERTKNNYHIISPQGKYIDFINERIKSLNLSRKLRSDAIYMNSFVLGSDWEFFKTLSKYEQRQFFEDCTNFFCDKYGRENVISAIVHEDETTPHMHLNFVPIVNRKLCSKDLFDKKKLSILQTEFYEVVGKKYGLKRGKEGSQAKHLSTAEFKANKIIEEAEEIRQETLSYKQALEEAKDGKIARGKKDLKNQIVAVTAENKELTKRLDIAMGETLQMAKENKILQERNERIAKHLPVISRLQKEHPELYSELQKPKEKPKPFNSRFNSNYK